MKNRAGFILISTLVLFCLCLLLLTAATLTLSQALRYEQRTQLLYDSLRVLQLTAAEQEVATNFQIRIIPRNNFQEVQILHGSQILGNLVLYAP